MARTVLLIAQETSLQALDDVDKMTMAGALLIIANNIHDPEVIEATLNAVMDLSNIVS